MNLHLWSVIALVTVASCYLSWRGWRVLMKAKGGCSSGCGCKGIVQPTTSVPEQTVLISSDSLKLRSRA